MKRNNSHRLLPHYRTVKGQRTLDHLVCQAIWANLEVTGQWSFSALKATLPEYPAKELIDSLYRLTDPKRPSYGKYDLGVTKEDVERLIENG